MTRTSRPDLADPTTAAAYRDRVKRLEPGTEPRWGTMTTGQMMAHCAEVLEVAAGKPLEGTPWLVRLLRPLVRRMVVSDRPYPRSTRTHPQYLVADDRDHAAARQRLLDAMDGFVDACAGYSSRTHPFFGTMAVPDLGWAMAKHLDHHLEQFGV